MDPLRPDRQAPTSPEERPSPQRAPEYSPPEPPSWQPSPPEWQPSREGQPDEYQPAVEPSVPGHPDEVPLRGKYSGPRP